MLSCCPPVSSDLNPSYQWWQIKNIRSCIMSPTGGPWQLLTESPLLWVFNHCFNPSQSLSVLTAWCIFTSAIDYQTIFDDYSSSPGCYPDPSLHAPYQDKAQSPPIRGLMKLTNQRPENCLHGLVILWREKNDDTLLICQCTFRLCLSPPTRTNRVMGQFKT